MVSAVIPKEPVGRLRTCPLHCKDESSGSEESVEMQNVLARVGLHIRVMEEKMETTIIYRVLLGLYWGNRVGVLLV